MVTIWYVDAGRVSRAPDRPLESRKTDALATRCVLATLTTNAQVLLYEPPNNAHCGQWTEVYELAFALVRLWLTRTPATSQQI